MRLDSATGADGHATRCHVIIRTIASRQLRNFALVVGEVEAQVPREVLLRNGFGVDGELDALILQRTYVGVHLILEIRSGRYVHVVNQVVRTTEIVVYRPREATIQETVVHTGVVSRRSLPLEVLIVGVGTIRFAIAVAYRIVSVVLAGRIRGKIGVVRTNILLTCDTVAEAQFHVRQGVHVLEESLFFHLPTKGKRGECAPSMILMES